MSGDTDDYQDVYERSGGTTRRVSAGNINGNGNFDASFGGASADGTRVFLQTSEGLVSDDTDGSRDVYERFGGATTLISRGAIAGHAGFEGAFRRASADGTRVFFETREQLVGGDNDQHGDVYAARVAP